MGAKSTQNRRPTRNERRQAKGVMTAIEQGFDQAIDTKPQRGRKGGARPADKVVKLELTKSQKQVGNLIKAKDLVFVEGAAGSGKTTGILAEFAQTYLADTTKQIIIIRTPVEAGPDKIGFLPNGLDDKIEPHFASAKEVLNLLLGSGKVQSDTGHRIHFKIPNYCLGSTWDNALVLIDEAQQMPPMIMKLLLERAGKNTKIVVAGDPSQLYVTDKNRNGLSHAMDQFIDKDGEPYYDSVDWFRFPLEDSKTRSELAYTVVHAYNTQR